MVFHLYFGQEDYAKVSCKFSISPYYVLGCIVKLGGLVQLGKVPMSRIPRQLPKSTGGRKGIPLCMNIASHCVNFLESTRGITLPYSGPKYL